MVRWERDIERCFFSTRDKIQDCEIHADEREQVLRPLAVKPLKQKMELTPSQVPDTNDPSPSLNPYFAFHHNIVCQIHRKTCMKKKKTKKKKGKGSDQEESEPDRVADELLDGRMSVFFTT